MTFTFFDTFFKEMILLRITFACKFRYNILHNGSRGLPSVALVFRNYRYIKAKQSQRIFSFFGTVIIPNKPKLIFTKAVLLFAEKTNGQVQGGKA